TPASHAGSVGSNPIGGTRKGHPRGKRGEGPSRLPLIASFVASSRRCRCPGRLLGSVCPVASLPPGRPVSPCGFGQDARRAVEPHSPRRTLRGVLVRIAGPYGRFRGRRGLGRSSASLRSPATVRFVPHGPSCSAVFDISGPLRSFRAARWGPGRAFVARDVTGVPEERWPLGADRWPTSLPGGGRCGPPDPTPTPRRSRCPRCHGPVPTRSPRPVPAPPHSAPSHGGVPQAMFARRTRRRRGSLVVYAHPPRDRKSTRLNSS